MFRLSELTSDDSFSSPTTFYFSSWSAVPASCSTSMQVACWPGQSLCASVGRPRVLNAHQIQDPTVGPTGKSEPNKRLAVAQQATSSPGQGRQGSHSPSLSVTIRIGKPLLPLHQMLLTWADITHSIMTGQLLPPPFIKKPEHKTHWGSSWRNH